MVALAADENFNNDILRGLLRRKPDLDMVRVQDAGLPGQPLIPSPRCLLNHGLCETPVG
jgi:hypothetical protein